MRRKLLALAVLFLAAGLVGLVGRICLVREGILYGAPQVSRVDGIVAGLAGIGLAFLSAFLVRQLGGAGGSGGGTFAQSRSFVDQVAVITALAGVVTLIVSGTNLFVPLERSGVAVHACPGARTRNAAYVGITAGPDGNNSRTGPARYYPADGRFPKDCALGFSAYCLGEPIADSAGSITGVQTWLTSRWLLLAKQPSGWKSFLAKHLSGEIAEPQFVSDANVVPGTNYEGLPRADDTVCSAAYQAPSPATLGAFDSAQQTFTARSVHAVNMGFAVWVPPDQGFQNANSYLQIFSPGFDAGHNPGMTRPDGSKTVSWAYHHPLLDRLAAGRAGGPHAKAEVVVMAIPCLSDNLPADPDTAAVAGYEIATHPDPVRVRRPHPGYDPAILANAACQTNN